MGTSSEMQTTATDGLGENDDEQRSPFSVRVEEPTEHLMLVTNDQWALAATLLVCERMDVKGWM